jgi:hypothetical protein
MRNILTKAILQLPDQERLVLYPLLLRRVDTEQVGLVPGRLKPAFLQLHASALFRLYAQLKDLDPVIVHCLGRGSRLLADSRKYRHIGCAEADCDVIPAPTKESCGLTLTAPLHHKQFPLVSRY